MKKHEGNLISREQFMELIFFQIEMINDLEALQEISDRVAHRLQIVGGCYQSKKNTSASKCKDIIIISISITYLLSYLCPLEQVKEEIKRQEHFKKAERKIDQIIHEVEQEQTLINLESQNSYMSQSPNYDIAATNQAISQVPPSKKIVNFDWIYLSKFQRFGLQLHELPEGIAENIFNDNHHNNKNQQGLQVLQIIERALNDRTIQQGNEIFSASQIKWIEFIVKGVKEYCSQYLSLNQFKNERQIQQEQISKNCKKVDGVFYNENKVVVIDWKFSPYSVTEQVYMQEGTHFVDQIAEIKKLFGGSKEVSIMIVPLKRLKDLSLIELTQEDIEKLQKEQINQDIFYQTKYKKMRNNILSKQFNLNMKCQLLEGKKHQLSLKEYFLDIITKQKKNWLEFYGDYKNCYSSQSKNINKDQFWALHVLLKEIQKNNEKIISIVEQSQHITQNKFKSSKQGDDEIDLIAMATDRSAPVLKKQSSSYKYKYRQSPGNNKSALQFICELINQEVLEDENNPNILIDDDDEFDDGDLDFDSDFIEIYELEKLDEEELDGFEEDQKNLKGKDSMIQVEEEEEEEGEEGEQSDSMHQQTKEQMKGNFKK